MRRWRGVGSGAVNGGGFKKRGIELREQGGSQAISRRRTWVAVEKCAREGGWGQHYTGGN
eukprot:2368355-Pleurochrysis_carterae.AAC.1